MSEISGGEPPPNQTSDVFSNHNEKNIQNNYDTNNKYSRNDLGPFFVYIEHKEKNLGKIFPIKIGYFLQTVQQFKNDVQDIKAIGVNRVKVIFKSYNIANSIVEHEVIKNNNLVAYIPKFFTHKKGIIRMVDTFFTEEYLVSAIISDIQAVEVRRLKRKIYDNETKETKYVDRQMIVVTFLGNKIPNNVKINMVNFPVEPYIQPVIQCFKCLRFGHTQSQCKGKERCKNCGEESCKTDACNEQTKKCTHCKSDQHNSLYKKCPYYTKQYTIKKTMAIENTSFKEAEAMVNNPSYAKIVVNNRFNILNNLENFPELSERTNIYNSNNNIQVIKKPINTILRKPEIRSTPSNSQDSNNKKRKASSPPQTPEINPSTSNKKSSIKTVIPNPYRDDFNQFKEHLSSQILILFNNILENKNNLSEETLKQQLSNIIDSLSNSNKLGETIYIDDEDDMY